MRKVILFMVAAFQTNPAWAADSSRIAAFAPENFPTALVDGKRAIPFVPKAKQIKTVEKILAAYLKEHHEGLSKKYASYFRQYTGLSIEGGGKTIRGNFMCQVEGDAWKKTWISVKDGGDCYFNFTFDVKAAKITSLDVNGEA